MNYNAILLKKLKDDSTLTFKVLSERTGISQAFLSMALSGKKNVNANTFEKILKHGFRLSKSKIYDYIQESMFMTVNDRLAEFDPIKAVRSRRERIKWQLFGKYQVHVICFSALSRKERYRPSIHLNVSSENRLNKIVIFFPEVKEEHPNLMSKGLDVIEFKDKGEMKNISPLELGNLLKGDLKKMLTLFCDELRKLSQATPSKIEQNACQMAIKELKLYMAIHYLSLPGIYSQPKKKLKGLNFDDFF